MKIIGKLLAILLMLALIFSLAACGDEEASKASDRATDAETEATEATEETEAATVPEELFGEWKHVLDVDKLLEAARNSGADEDELAFVEKVYSDLTNPTLTVDLKEDGAFTLAFDEESTKKIVENMMEVLPQMYAGTFDEAALAEMDLTRDDLLAATVKEFSAEKSLFGIENGTFTYEDGKLKLIGEDGNGSLTVSVELVDDELHVVAFGDADDGGFPPELLPINFVR